uniref:Uncharacterized protein n=1 Tax=Cyprinodon variegatus TaxID=28743 RepID=A0A3Q2CYW2_CYPVA
MFLSHFLCPLRLPIIILAPPSPPSQTLRPPSPPAPPVLVVLFVVLVFLLLVLSRSRGVQPVGPLPPDGRLPAALHHIRPPRLHHFILLRPPAGPPAGPWPPAHGAVSWPRPPQPLLNYNKTEPEPTGPMEPEPAGPVEPEPTGPMEPEPAGPVEPEPAGPVEPEPAAGPVEPEPNVLVVPSPTQSETQLVLGPRPGIRTQSVPGPLDPSVQTCWSRTP